MNMADEDSDSFGRGSLSDSGIGMAGVLSRMHYRACMGSSLATIGRTTGLGKKKKECKFCFLIPIIANANATNARNGTRYTVPVRSILVRIFF